MFAVNVTGAMRLCRSVVPRDARRQTRCDRERRVACRAARRGSGHGVRRVEARAARASPVASPACTAPRESGATPCVPAPSRPASAARPRRATPTTSRRGCRCSASPLARRSPTRSPQSSRGSRPTRPATSTAPPSPPMAAGPRSDRAAPRGTRRCPPWPGARVRALPRSGAQRSAPGDARVHGDRRGARPHPATRVVCMRRLSPR